MAGMGPGGAGGGPMYAGSYASNVTIGELQELSVDPKLIEKIERMERNLEKVMERLAVLDDPSPEKLEKFKQLKVAHDKYKFLEELCGKDES